MARKEKNQFYSLGFMKMRLNAHEAARNSTHIRRSHMSQEKSNNRKE